MKKLFLFILSACLYFSSFSQERIKPADRVIHADVQLLLPHITLYEDANFGGRSKDLPVGEYRLDDFNDIASSIRIPSGFAVFIFESFDDEGGFGMWADLATDIPNLNQASLNDKVSFIKVFSAANNGLVWIPAQMINGALVPGHWERQRANPVPFTGYPVAGRILFHDNTQPHSEDADIGYGPLPVNLGDYTPWWLRDSWVNFDADDVKVKDAKTDVNLVCPQHRSVGEPAALALPKKTYRALEGIVRTSGTAGMDFPTSHYTHDFDFNVVPDPAYHYIMGDYITGPGNNGVGYKRADSQKDIEVEWESGLAQDNVLDGVANPATAVTRYGKSFGFFTAGHVNKDLLWNWPANGDHVHVEGLWIWERAHQPVHTEIHPAHFVAVQRKLPVSFIYDASNRPVIRNQGDDKYIATRVDVFASGDGNPQFNNKGLNPSFNQITDMNRKDYSFVITHPFTKVVQNNPTRSAVLRCVYVKQNGDNFPPNAEPVINFFGDNQVRVTIPWQSRNVPNNAIFARTFLVYWDDVSSVAATGTVKVLDSEKPKLYQVTLVKLNLTEKQNGDNYGNFRIFCNLGSNWVFLNEFTDGTNGDDILGSGLGKNSNTTSFNINKSFNIYLPATPSRLNNTIIYENLQMKTTGWVTKGIDILMGHIINEYSRDKDVVNKFFGTHLRYVDQHGGADSPAGSFDKLFNPLVIDQERNTGPQVLLGEWSEKKDNGSYQNHHVYDLIYTIKEITYSGTVNSTTRTAVINQ